MKIKNIKKGFVTISILAAMVISMPFASSLVIKAQTYNDIYEITDEIPQKEVGLVLGAAAYGDRLSDILRDRVDTAIDLYNTEKISAMIMSGSADETRAMKKYAINLGIPEAAVIEDPAGLNTLASVKNISNLERSVIIITQKYHLPRALFMADHLKVDAIGVISDRHTYIKISEFKAREILATTKAMLDLIILSN